MKYFPILLLLVASCGYAGPIKYCITVPDTFDNGMHELCCKNKVTDSMGNINLTDCESNVKIIYNAKDVRQYGG